MIRKGNKTGKQKKKTLSNVNIHFKGRNAIRFVEDYGSMILDAKRNATEGIGVKILTPKQILQRSPIPLVQVKTGDNSDIY